MVFSKDVLSAEQIERVLQQALDFLQETGNRRAIKDAMIRRHRHRHQVTNHRLTIYGHEALARRCYRQDSGLWRIDDRDEVRDIHHAQVRDGECAAFKIGLRELVGAGLLNQRLRLAGNGAHALDIGVADHRNDQTSRNVYSYPYIDMFVLDELTILEGTVALREFFQGKRAGFHNQIINADLYPIFTSARVEGLAHCQRIGHIHLAADIKVRDSLDRK